MRVAHKLTSTSLYPSSLQRTSPRHALGKYAFCLCICALSFLVTVEYSILTKAATIGLTIKLYLFNLRFRHF